MNVGDRMRLQCPKVDGGKSEWDGVEVRLVYMPHMGISGRLIVGVELLTPPPNGWRIGNQCNFYVDWLVPARPLSELELGIVAYIAAEKKELGLT